MLAGVHNLVGESVTVLLEGIVYGSKLDEIRSCTDDGNDFMQTQIG